jgi:hypothetical protein
MIDDMLTSNLNAKGSDINTWTKNKSLESKDNSIVNLFINNVNIEKNDNSRIKPEIKKTDISVINKSEVLNEKSENKSENKSEVLNEKIEKDIINLSRNFNNENKSEVLNEKIEKDIINLSRNFNNENKNDIFDLLKNVNKLSTFSMNIVSSIIKDSTEYGEYADNHSSTILSFLENYDISKLSFDNLSTAIAAAGEDMGDIKIDAPKAPKNMSFIIGKILKGTKTGKIEININKTTIMSNDISKYDDSKKEWDNILKLTENFIDKDTLINRFEILKYNN